MESDELTMAKFCDVTTANPEQVQFYLECIEPALQLVFDSDGGAQTRATAMSLEVPAPDPPPRSGSFGNGSETRIHNFL
jgi:hypothetical protein